MISTLLGFVLSVFSIVSENKMTEEIEILDIDVDDVIVDSDKGASNLSIQSDSDRKKNVRKVVSGGGKAPHVAVSFKPVRKPQVVAEPENNNERRMSLRSRGRPKKKASENIECFDIGDSESDNSDASDDEEIQVLDDTVDGIDPDLEEISITGGVSNTDGFCELCGLYLDTITDIEQHHVEVHKIVLCKWCNKKVTLSKIRSHIGSSCPKFDKILGSHCSIHNKMETDEMLKEDEFRNCRPWSCDACGQRYDRNSLMEPAEIPDSFVCPGCLHGRVRSLDNVTASEEKVVEEIDLDEETETREEAPSTESVVLDIIEEILVDLVDNSVEPASVREYCPSENTPESSNEPVLILDGNSEEDTSQDTSQGEVDIDEIIMEVESKVVDYLIDTATEFLNKTNAKISDNPTEVVNSQGPEENFCDSKDSENNSSAKELGKPRISPTKEASVQELSNEDAESVVTLDDTKNGDRSVSNDVGSVSISEDIVMLDNEPDCETITHVETQESLKEKQEESASEASSPKQDQSATIENPAKKSNTIEVVSLENDDSIPEVVSLDVSQDTQVVKPTGELENTITLNDDEGETKKPAEEPVRRVAKKSTRPPIRPQTQPSEEDLRNNIENPRKRKADSPLKGGSPRKTARKSTRPPIAPQVLSFMFVDESREEDEVSEVTEVADEAEVTEIATVNAQKVADVVEDREKEWEKIREHAWGVSDEGPEMDTSVLLASPGRDKIDDDSDIEEITIC